MWGNTSSVKMIDSNFSENEALKGGGVMYADIDNMVNIENCSIYNNKCDDDGGVLNILDFYQINISNSKISNNSVIKSLSKAEGGVIRAESKY